MHVQIPYSVARQLADHAQADYPNEVCGLLAGIGSNIDRSIPIGNISDNPQEHYQMNPSEHVKALKRFDNDGMEWLGIYHSHPKTQPIPSQSDLNDITDYSLFHIIVSLKDSRPKLTAWKISETSVMPLDLIFDTQSPANDAHEPLSNPQKTAIILTSILCVILMLVISFTLLPPAPTITPFP